MKCGFIVDRDLFAGFDVAQGDEENVIVEDLHESVGNTRVIYVVRAIATATAIQTPATVNFTNSQRLSMRSPACFSVGDSLARIFSYLVSFPERYGGETAFAMYRRRLDC